MYDEGQESESIPWSYQVEATVLGAVLSHPGAANEAMEVLVASDFFNTNHQKIFSTIVEMTEANESVDLITTWQALQKKKIADEVGAPGYLAQITEGIPKNPNIKSYLRILREQSVLRSIQALAQQAGAMAVDASQNPGELIGMIEERVLELSQRSSGSSFKSMLDSMQEAGGFDPYVESHIATENAQGVRTGFVDYDRMIGGFRKQELIIIAARPSMGKTALAICMAVNVAHTSKDHVVAVFSIEMSRQALEQRMIAAYGMVDWNSVKAGFISRETRAKIAGTSKWLADKNILVDDTASITVLQLRAKARKLKQKYGRLDLIVIDYLQLVSGGQKHQSREQEVAAISRGLKAMAKELDVPVVALAQLSRAAEGRKDRRPMLTDLRESGQIEQDADVVTFIHREEYYRSADDEDVERGIAELNTAKQRNGPTGTVKVVYHDKYTRFDNLQYEGRS